MKFIAVTENKKRFAWETKVYLSSLREFDYSKDCHILVFLNTPEKIKEWQDLENEYSEVSFFYFKDKGISVIANAFKYPPIHRLYCLQEHWKDNKYLEKEAILYTDTDIIFTKKLDFEPFLKDDINYVSWTGTIHRTDNYLGLPYLESKINQVVPEKVEQYKKLDIPARLAGIVGITREKLEENIPNTGGAQYLLKNITSQFWTDCFNTCCEIKTFLAGINQTFMQGITPNDKENAGFQSWCADMWAVLYNIWKTAETRTPVEFDFAWSTDVITRANEVYFLHNAGVVSADNIKVANSKDENGISKELEGPLFFKGLYDTYTPWEDSNLINIYEDPVNQLFCNNLYIKQILKSNKNGN